MKPHELLGVPATANEEEIRAAYLSKVKEFPPDSAPEQFERIRDAYALLRDPRNKARAVLFNEDFTNPLPDLLKGLKPKRVYTGPNLWREALKSK